MIVYKNYVTFTVLGQEINLISSETDYGISTVAEVDNYYHYLGNEPVNILAAILAWQELNNRNLNNEEIHQIMLDNHLISEAI